MNISVSLFPSFLFLMVICLTIPVYAQTSTDAGALLQQIEQERQTMQPDAGAPVVEPEHLAEKSLVKDEVKIVVKSFRFQGNTLLSDKKLASAVKKYINRPNTYIELENAAAAVGEAYRKKGWAVRSFLPKQDIVDGVVLIQIIEADFGEVLMEEQSHVWPKNEKIKNVVAVQQSNGKALNTNKLERAILILDDLPGITASGRLQQGQQDGQTDLIIKTTKESLVSGAFIADNEGSRSTGHERGHAFVQLMNPFGLADASSAYILYSEGLRFARFEQTFPIGDNGWRVGANTSIIDYEVLPSEFESLDAKGDATSIGAQASYPFIRTREKNLYLNLNYDHKYFNNEAQNATSSKYEVDNYTTALRGSMIDKFAGGGNTQVNLGVIFGNLTLNTLNTGEDPALDSCFQKMTYSITRQQTIIPKVSLYSAFSGQFSSKRRLDSSEKFYLGGPNGVRAYPVGEASGVEGTLSKTELRWKFAPNYQLSGFYDYGHVNNYGSIQSYSLDGAGLELAWQSKFGLNIKFTWAHRIGENPNPTSSGNDQDGSLDKDRFWLRLSLQF